MNIFKWLAPAKRVAKPTEDQAPAVDTDQAPEAEPIQELPAPPDGAEFEDLLLAPAVNTLQEAGPREAEEEAPASEDGEIGEADEAGETGEDGEDSEDGKAPASAPDDEEFESLRRLLLGRELDGLDSLQQRLDDPDLLARTLGPAVTEALFVRTQTDRKLDVVLRATVERIIRSSVRRNPREMADNLFPVMGPALRKSIAASLRGLLRGLGGLLEKSVSPTGLKWRLTALRTGRPFREVALLNTLDYRVEQVFLVHTRTGAPLVHLVNKGVRPKDASDRQAAAMLTALKQSVADSSAEGELNDLAFGDLHIAVVQGPEAHLACVVRGQTPPRLRRVMRSLLELLIVDLAEELEDFQGDLKPFQRSRRLLENLLVSRRKDEGRKPSPAAVLFLVLVAALLLGPAIQQGYQKFEAARKAYAEAAMERRLHEATAGPGLSLVKVWLRPDKVWELTFMKDDLAEGPEEKLAALGLSPGQARLIFLPYVSQDRELVERRAVRILAGRPENLTLDFDWSARTLILSGQADLGRVLSDCEALRSLPGVRAVHLNGLEDQETGVTAELGRDQVLRLHGRASIPWREALKEKAAAVSGLNGLDLSGLEDDAAALHLKELLSRLNGTVIYFPAGQDQPENQGPLRQAADDLVALEKLAEPMGLAVSLAIHASADPAGQARQNYDQGQARARTLAALLYERGSAISISTFGTAPAGEAFDEPPKKAAAQARRRLELQVRLERRRAPLNLD